MENIIKTKLENIILISNSFDDYSDEEEAMATLEIRNIIENIKRIVNKNYLIIFNDDKFIEVVSKIVAINKNDYQAIENIINEFRKDDCLCAQNYA